MMVWDLMSSDVGLTYCGQGPLSDDPSLISLMVSVDVNHHIYLLSPMIWGLLSSDEGLTY